MISEEKYRAMALQMAINVFITHLKTNRDNLISRIDDLIDFIDYMSAMSVFVSDACKDQSSLSEGSASRLILKKFKSFSSETFKGEKVKKNIMDALDEYEKGVWFPH